MFQNIHLANYVNSINSSAQQSRGRSQKDGRVPARDAQLDNGSLTGDITLNQIVAVGTHLSTTGIAQKAGANVQKNVTQISKKKSIWRPSTKKDFIAQMNSTKPRLNSDLFQNYDQKQLFSSKPKHQRNATSIPKKVGSKLSFASRIAEMRVLDNSLTAAERIHTLHPLTPPQNDATIAQDQAVKDMVFNSSLKKSNGEAQGGSIFDEHHASSSKEDAHENRALDIILGNTKPDKDKEVSYASELQSKQFNDKDVSKSNCSTPIMKATEVQVGNGDLRRRISSELAHSSLINRTQYGHSQQVLTTASMVSKECLPVTDRFDATNTNEANSRSLERHKESNPLKSKEASTYQGLGILETGKGSIVSLDRDVVEPSYYNDLVQQQQSAAMFQQNKGLKGIGLFNNKIQHTHHHVKGSRERMYKNNQIPNQIVVTSGQQICMGAKVNRAENQRTSRSRSPKGKGSPARQGFGAGAAQATKLVESPQNRLGGTTPVFSGLKGRKVPKNSSFMRNCSKPKTQQQQQITSKQSFNSTAYVALVEAPELVGILKEDHDELTLMSPTVIKENIHEKKKQDQSRLGKLSPKNIVTTDVAIGIKQRSMSQDPTVTAGRDNRSQSPQSIVESPSPQVAKTQLHLFAYDKETFIVNTASESVNAGTLQKSFLKLQPGPETRLGIEIAKPGSSMKDLNPTDLADNKSEQGVQPDTELATGSVGNSRPARNMGKRQNKTGSQERQNDPISPTAISTVNVVKSNRNALSGSLSPKSKYKDAGPSAKKMDGQQDCVGLSNDCGILNYPPPDIEMTRHTITSGRSSQGLASQRLLSGQINRQARSSHNNRNWQRRNRVGWSAARQATGSQKEQYQRLVLSGENSAKKVADMNISQLIEEAKALEQDKQVQVKHEVAQVMNPIKIKSYSPSVAEFATDEQLRSSGNGFVGGMVVSPTNNAFTSQSILRTNRLKHARQQQNRVQHNKTQQHLKYELIEKLLSQDKTDKEQTAKNLEEMTTLYQGLLENTSQASIQIIQHYNALKNSSQHSLIAVDNRLVTATDTVKQTHDSNISTKKRNILSNAERWYSRKRSSKKNSISQVMHTSMSPQTKQLRTRSAKKVNTVGTKQSFNVPLNQRTSRKVNQILQQHASIPNVENDDNNYVDRDYIETQLSQGSPEKSLDRERSNSVHKQPTVLYSQANDLGQLNVGNQTSSLNTSCPAISEKQMQQVKESTVKMPYNTGDKKSPPLVDKKSEGKSSRVGKYNFQGRLIIGTEVGKDLRERERFIREQFSNASLNTTGARRPEAIVNRGVLGSATSMGGGNIEDSEAPNDYNEALPKSISPIEFQNKAVFERKAPKKQLSSSQIPNRADNDKSNLSKTGQGGRKAIGKQVSKQEVTVPGAGHLNQGPRGRIKARSSNKVLGFMAGGGLKLRTKSGGMGSSGTMHVDTNTNNNSKRYLSNHDMLNILEQPRKGKFGQFQNPETNQVLVNVQNTELDDGDEVGTQMLSKAVLPQGRLMSKASASNEDFKQIGQAYPKSNYNATMRDLYSRNKNLDEASELKKSRASFQTDGRNIRPQEKVQERLSLAHIKVQGDGEEQVSGRIGTIKVQEFYHQQIGQNAEFRELLLNSSRTQVASDEQELPPRLDLDPKCASSQKSVSSDGKQNTLFKNFERLSGLINEQTMQQRLGQKLQPRVPAPRMKARQEDLSRTTYLYRDLQERIHEQDQHLNDFFEFEKQKQLHRYTSSPNQSHVDMRARTQRQNLPAVDLSNRQTVQDGKQRKVFTVSRNAVNSNNKKLIKLLLHELDINAPSVAQVPMFKQNCLVQYIMETWKSQIHGQLKQFSQFCKFTSNLKIRSGDSVLESESYSIILYGKQTPVSRCCNQLICFQFIRELSITKIYCLEPTCKKSLLEVSPIDNQNYHTIFLTKNCKVIPHSNPDVGTSRPKTNPLLGNISMNQVRAQSQYSRRRDEKGQVSNNFQVQLPSEQEYQKTDITIKMTSPIYTKGRESRQELLSEGEAPRIQDDCIEKPNVIHVSMLLKNKASPSVKPSSGTEGLPCIQEAWIPLNVLQQHVPSGAGLDNTPGTAMLHHMNNVNSPLADGKS